MTRQVQFRAIARTEFVEAAARYESQREGLGLEFISAIERCVVFAAEHAELFAVQRKDIRRITAARFPYCVYFRSEPDRIVVLAVFHTSRDPTVWPRRT